MPNISPHDQLFLDKLRGHIEQNMSNEGFGVSELAADIGMSRSNLLRKVKKLTGQSVSQLIREVRLQRAMTLLTEGTMNVSEASDEVGFASTSYFIKCFREEYGYPPGEVGKMVQPGVEEQETAKRPAGILTRVLVVAGIFIVLLVAFLVIDPDVETSESLEKSIAVLPFKNDSSDSSNVYLINGLMESTLNNLQKIGDLRVISRTSTEKYRNSPKSIPEIAKDLNVSYFVDGSGQKIGGRIMLNIQLIEASTDRQLWAAQYQRDTEDIFQLQQEIASTIANEIKAIITPAERQQITKIPTSNLVAYDNYLKGRNLVVMGDREKLLSAVSYFKKAIDLDENFSGAYAAITVCYFYLDMYLAQKQYQQDIKENAEKAMMLDSNSSESLIAISLYHHLLGNYPKQVEYLEDALKLAPNDANIINTLSDLYATYMPNTNKYLEYALRGIQLNHEANDSLTTSYLYLHLSNALIQSGFVEESIYYVNRSLDYSEANGFSNYVKAFMLYAQEKDIEKLRSRLITEWKKDSTRLDILQEIGKVSFFMRDYETAYKYYDIFLAQREAYDLDIFRYENLKIGMVYEHVGEKEKAQALIDDYYDYAINDESYYKDIFLYAYYAYLGDEGKALEYLEDFSKLENYQYWFILFEDDPTDDFLDANAQAEAFWKVIREKFWKNHEELKMDLKEKGLI